MCTSYGLFIQVSQVSVHGHSYKQTLLNTDTIKNFVQNVKCLEFLAKVTVRSPVMLIVTVYVKITSSCAV